VPTLNRAKTRHAGVTRFEAAVKRHLDGDFNAALAGYDEIVAKWPGYAEAHNNAGSIRAERSEYDKAIAHFRRAVELQPAYPDAHHNLGLALYQSGAAADAVVALQRATEVAPDRAVWFTDLGNALVEEQRFDEALAAYDRALMLAPTDIVAIANRALALRGLRRHQEAAASCEAALAIRADHLDSLSNLGVIYKEMRKFEAARATFDRALAIAPGHTTIRVNLAVLLMEMGRTDEAAEIAEKLVAERPELVEPWNVLHYCWFERGEFARAAECTREALARDARDRNANWNSAVHTLLHGDLSEGFKQFESRKRLVSVVFSSRRYGVPEWDGAPLDGRSIFVHAEQGLGDSIQFVRYAKLLKARGAGRVIMECSPTATSLLSTVEGIDELVVPGTPLPPFDVHAYLMSLPLLLGTTLSDVPAEVPYMRASSRPVAERVQNAPPGLRVGLAWAGNALHQRDLVRSISLETLAPVLGTEGVTFFSLQKGPASRQLTTLQGANIIDLDPDLNDLADTAAAIAELDLVITVDTAIAHLAGALGKPVWVLISHVPDWRWMLGRDDSPWYPTMRLFRQPMVRAWVPAIAAVARALTARVAAHAVTTTTSTPHAVKRVAPAAAPARRPVEISWPIGTSTGWGTYGLHLALALHLSSNAEPILGEAPMLQGLGPLAERRVGEMRRSAALADSSSTIRLTALGNHVLGAPRIGQSRVAKNAGVIFFEDTALDAAALERARSYDLMIAGSTWNAEWLKALGVPNVRMVLQGVDPSLFHRAPRAGLFGDRFLVFTGGKLEYRKGQDIVVEAFRRFQAKHSDAMLVTAWHNHWPQTMAGIDASGYVRGTPAVRNGRCEVTEWLIANGVRADAILDLGLQPHALIAQALREMHVALFPNRCEGGTNLVAMEAMACGVPTILSANTGHLNLIGRDTCFPLVHQRPVTLRTPLYNGTAGWGESDPEEIVSLLELAYHDREEARRRGTEGAALLAQISWNTQANVLLRTLEN
jgi:tetratricopeptide (TPR) repeat protein/glycosyltransferase involved in cell wall biosynthesis